MNYNAGLPTEPVTTTPGFFKTSFDNVFLEHGGILLPVGLLITLDIQAKSESNPKRKREYTAQIEAPSSPECQEGVQSQG